MAAEANATDIPSTTPPDASAGRSEALIKGLRYTLRRSRPFRSFARVVRLAVNERIGFGFAAATVCDLSVRKKIREISCRDAVDPNTDSRPFTDEWPTHVARPCSLPARKVDEVRLNTATMTPGKGDRPGAAKVAEVSAASRPDGAKHPGRPYDDSPVGSPFCFIF